MKLIVFTPEGRSEVALVPGVDLTVGRASTSDVVLREKRASRAHCRITWQEGRPVAIDLGSANGTLISSARAGAARGRRIAANWPQPLAHHDRLEIGECALLVEAPELEAFAAADSGVEAASGAVAASASSDASIARREPAAVESDAAGPAGLATQATGAPALVRTRSPVSSAVRAIVALAVIGAVVMIGVDSYRKIARQQALEVTFARAEAAESARDYDQAVALYDEVLETGSTSPLAEEARARSFRITTMVAREREVIEAFDRIDAEYSSGTLSTADTVAQLEALTQRYAGTRGVIAIKVRLGEISETLAAERDASYQTMLTLAQEAVDGGHFAQARLVLADFLAAYEPGPWRKAVDELDVEIKRRARLDYSRLLASVDELIATDRLEEARNRCATRLSDYSGTPLDLELREKMAYVAVLERSFDLGVAKPEAAEITETIAEARPILAATAAADELVLAGDLAGARQALIALEAEFPTASNLAWRRRGVEAELALHAKAIAAINAGALASPDKAMRFGASSARFVFTSADTEKVVLGLIGGDGKAALPRKWMTFPATERLAIYQALELEPRDRIGVAAFAFRNGLDVLGEDGGPGQAELIRALKLEPSLAAEINEFYAGVRGMPVPPDGFQAYQKDFLLTQAECQDQDLLTRVRKALAKLEDLYGSTKDDAIAARQVQWQELGSVREQAVALDRGKLLAKVDGRVVQTILPIRRERVSRLRQQTELPEKVRAILDGLLGQLEAARKHALELIYDEAVYTYDQAKGDHGEKAQPDVDDRVAKVRAIWENPAGSASEIDPAVRILTQQVREMDEKVVIFDPEAIAREIAELGEAFDLTYIESLANQRLDIKSYAPSSSDRRHFAKAQEIMKANEEMTTIATDFEKRQVRILNEYRIMMGRLPLAICDQLVMAARRHSEYMASSGQFAHVIQGHPDGATPSERGAKQGYGGGVAENIAMGMGDPQGAHDGWYNSSGHHRNMLSDGHSVMGTGNSGAHWTQNFGSSSCGALPGQ